jgi:hypothetical protein
MNAPITPEFAILLGILYNVEPKNGGQNEQARNR